MIDLRRVEGFCRVAAAGGYARAVREFPYPITEPAVHQQVKKLEAELGHKLLRRVAKDRMATTRAGRYLYESAAPLLERLAEVEREIQAGQFLRTLRVDAGPQEMRHVLPGWLARLRERREDVRVELCEVASVSLGRLLSGETDVVVEYFPDPPPAVSQRVVATVRGVWVLPAALARSIRWNFARLAGVPFIGFPKATREHALQLRGLAHQRLAPREQISASSVDAIVALVEAGLGYSLVPWPSRHGPELPRLACRELGEPDAVFEITASFVGTPEPGGALEAFLDCAGTRGR